MTIAIKRLDKTLPLPKYESAGAAGIDLYAAVDIRPTDWFDDSVLVPTGIAVEIQHGYVGMIKSRSSVASKLGLDVAAGVIDEDYRGEVKVLLRNTSREFPSKILKGTRIAQLLFLRCDQHLILEVEELSETPRGEGGFGSTDNKIAELMELGYDV